MDKVIFTFPVLYAGWELDEEGYVLEREDRSRYIELTNHGKRYKANVNELQSKIIEYMKAIEETKVAIAMVK